MYFATSSVGLGQRHAAWQDVIAATCGAFETAFTRGDVNAAIETVRIGSLDCAKITQDVQRVSRSEQEILSAKTEHCFLVLQLAGGTDLTQHERCLAITPGDVVLLDSAAPFIMTMSGRTSQICVHIPKDDLASRMQDWKCRLGCKLPAPSNYLVQSLVTTAFGPGESVSPSASAILSDAIVGLVATGWQHGGALEPGANPQPSERLRDVRNFILMNLTHEDLSPRKIAAATAVSERQLHRLFAASGTSLSQWIRQARLERCARDFRDPNLRERSITEIAFAWGFNDSAHFSRAFREAFGVSPREYRKGVAWRH